MKFKITGHDRETAVLDMLIALIPDEKHEICFEEDAECISILENADNEIISKAVINYNGIHSTGECMEVGNPCGEERKRVML